MEKILKHYRMSFFLVAVSLLLALGAFMVLDYYGEKTAKEIRSQAYNILEDSAWQQANLVTAMIEDRFRVLDAAAMFSEELSNPQATERVWRQFEPLLRKMRFSRLTMVDIRGHGMTSDGHHMNLSQRAYFKDAASGKRMLEYIPDPLLGGGAMFLFIVPIYEKGRQTGALTGSCPVTMFEDTMVSRAFGSSAYSFMCTGDMQVILESRHSSYINGGSDFWHFLNSCKIIRGSSLKDTERDFKAGSPGWIAYMWNGESRFMAYHPLGINGWMICNAVPEYDLDATTNALTDFGRQIAGLILLMSLAFFAILFVIDRRQKQQLRIEHELIAASEERARIAMQNTSVSIWDYDIRAKCIIQTDHSMERHGFGRIITNVPEGRIEDGTIHPESHAVYLEMYRKLAAGEKKAGAVIKERTKDGSGWWYESIEYTTLFDEDGRPYKAIGMGSDVTESELKKNELRRAAQTDSLTGLLNHEATFAAIREWLAEGHHSEGVLFAIDLDRFKELNDTFGHLEGDNMLTGSAKRMGDILGPNDIIGRVGGDEFLVLMKNAGRADTEKNAETLLRALSVSFVKDGRAVHLSASIGIAFAIDGDTLESFYGRADAALYKAKEQGRSRWYISDDVSTAGTSINYTPIDGSGGDM